jgi:phage terminase large subunit-like protein|nr:MAG TPA: Large Terminase [Caudoviricetes sp.]
MKEIEKEIREKITTYPWDVLEGKILTCENIKLACKRFMDFLDMEDRYFDVEDVERTIRFFERFRHFTGQYNNKPFILQEWQKFMICGIYGFKWKKDGTRVTRTFILSVCRKSGKSSIISIMALKALLEENNAQVIVAANSASQASILFNMASSYLKSLGGKVDKLFRRFRYRIMFDETDSSMRVVSADASRLDGLNCNFAVVDEISQAPNSDVYDVLESSMGSRQQPLMCCCTTRSNNQSGFYKELEQSGIDVLRGLKQDDSVFCMVYTLDDGDDCEDEKVWKKCSPNLGISVSEDFYRQQITKMKNNPSQTTAIMTKVFNVWTSTSNVWIPQSYTFKVMDKVKMDDFKDKLLYLSFDLASTSDLTCLSAMYEDNGTYYFKNWYYLPQEALKTSTNKDNYKKWQRQGFLTVTQGNVTDYDYVMNDIQKLQDNSEGIARISYDSWNATDFTIRLTESGFNMKPYSQSIGSMNRPTKAIERLIMEGKNIVIDKNPITLFCFENSVPKPDYNDNIKIIKESYENKIDGVVAIIMNYGGFQEENHYDGSLIEGISL